MPLQIGNVIAGNIPEIINALIDKINELEDRIEDLESRVEDLEGE